MCHFFVLPTFWHYPCSINEVTILNRPFYSYVLICQAFDLEWGWSWPCCDRDQYLVCIITKSFTFEKQQGLFHNRSPLASLLFKGLATKHATVKWTIVWNSRFHGKSEFDSFLYNYEHKENQISSNLAMVIYVNQVKILKCCY